MENDNIFMEHCLKLAMQARKNKKTAVGSVIVLEGKIIAEGVEGDPSLPTIMSHAENIAILNALRQLNKNLNNCVLYTTVEPCFMCSYLIRQTKIGKVVYGTETPAGGDSSAHPILKSTEIKSWGTPPEVTAGVLRNECEKLLKK